MNLHTDLPTCPQIDRLLESRHAASVSMNDRGGAFGATMLSAGASAR